MNNFETFFLVYSKHLKDAIEKKPSEYAYPISELPSVLDRMSEAIKRGSFNKDGYAFKTTCKELRIKHTYKGIDAFIKGGAK